MIKHLANAVLATAFAGLSIASVQAREIYVAKNGNDSNNGTLAAPYKTITKAANVAQAGDTVHIRAGTYEETLRPANSGRNNQPITFQSYRDEKVVISAMQSLSGWSKDSGQVYRTKVDFDLEQKNFVMHRDKALDLARWPNNTDGDPFTPNSLRNTGGTGSNTEFNARLDYANGIPNFDWSKGGSVWFYGDKPGSGWIAWKAFIKWSNNNSVGFDLNKNPTWIRTFHAPADKGDFFLEGVRGALDYQNEWYFDPQSKQLYVQLPNGAKPQDGAVKMRKRLLTVDLNNRNYIHLKDLAVFGGSINITGRANNNLVSGVSSFYGNHTRGIFRGFNSGSQSIHVQGSNNTVEHSEIGFGSGTGVKLAGEGNKLLNSYIHDFNTLGSYDAILVARGGRNSLVRGNTISGGGRDAINASNRSSEYSYNDVSRSNRIADDCGLFYTVGGPQDVEIHHNWFHDAYSSGSKRKAAGIYLDNDATGFSVHHNVVWNTEWSNIQMNWDVVDVDVFNNTFVDGSVTMGAWHKAGTKFTDVRVWNNLSDKSDWEPQSDKQNNVTYTQNPFVNKANGNFRLRANSQAQNQGRFITGITTDVTDSRPDVGAYEYGGTQWVAGVDWSIDSGAANRCYQLPGEKCGNGGGVPTPDPDPTPDPTPTPPSAGGQAIPGTIEAESYTAQNGVRKVNQNKAVGYINNGDYIEFDVNVARTGEYDLSMQLASNTQGGTLAVSSNGQAIGSLTTGNTGGWRTFAPQATKVSLSAGRQKLRLTFTGGTGFLLDVDSMQFTFYAPPAADDSISFANPVTELQSQKTYTFRVDYQVAGEQELVVDFWKGATWLGNQTVRVQAGSGTANVKVDLTEAPAPGNDYDIKTFTYPVGGSWRDSTANDRMPNVRVVAAPPPSLLSNSTYMLVSPANGQRLQALASESHNGRMANANNSGDQRWAVVHLGNEIYTFKNLATNRYLEVPYGRCQDRTNVATWLQANSAHHRWKVSKNGNAYMLSPSHCEQQALDRAAGRANANAITWRTTTSNPNQQWRIVKP